jgi:hypothetical protein
MPVLIVFKLCVRILQPNVSLNFKFCLNTKQDYEIELQYQVGNILVSYSAGRDFKFGPETSTLTEVFYIIPRASNWATTNSFHIFPL